MDTGEVRTNRLMWFAAGAAMMAIYLLGPHTIVDRGYGMAQSASLWVQSR